jgi:mannose-1-phosphate guanylyltransferase/mannose-6-phosphate isomerase
MLRPVILSGGSGTRLWPLSTPDRPKQFLPLLEERPMIVATIERLEGLAAGTPMVVCGEAHADLVRAEVPSALLILEPEGRNTAPAIAVAAILSDPEDLLLVLPSDHLITDGEGFRDAVRKGMEAAQDGDLVTFGVVATGPSTGYGYIRPGEPLNGIRLVDEFVEKPDRTTAMRYVEDGYLWNSGMFLFTAEAFLDELDTHRPDLLATVRSAVEHGAIDAAAWSAVPAESVDTAVMENTDRAIVIAIDVGWNDVGSWDSLADLTPSDASESTVIGDVIALDIGGSYVRTTGPTIAIAGVDDLIVVATDEAVLIVPRGESQRVKDLLRRLEES